MRGRFAKSASWRLGLRLGGALLAGCCLAVPISPGWAQATSVAPGEAARSPAGGVAPNLAGTPAAQLYQVGAQLFLEARCFVCHGEDGFGGAGPRFRNDRFLAIGDYVAGQILIGRKIMPSFADTLSDDQIAALATYVRNSWGNAFGPVTPAQVTRVRHEMVVKPLPDHQVSGPAMQPSNAPAPPHSPLPPGVPIPPTGLGTNNPALTVTAPVAPPATPTGVLAPPAAQ